MKNPKSFRYARPLMLAALSSLGIVSYAAQDVPKNVTVSGYLDLYYMYDFNNPTSGTADVESGSRQFDVIHNSFSLAAFQLNASLAPTAENPFGGTVSLIFGKNADIINGSNSSWRNVLQAYATYSGTGGLTVDFGKFLTWIGYEGVASADQDNYSRSSLFYYAQPIYHTGFRVSKPITPKLNASVYLVNGINEVDDSNDSKSYGATLSTSVGATSITANYYGGNEGPKGLTYAEHLGDLVVTHQLTEKVKLALNADYASRAFINGGGSDHVYGVAGYVTAALSNNISGALRFESVSPTTDAHVTSLTGTLSWKGSANSVTRLELRWDKSDSDAYFSDSSPISNGSLMPNKDSRTTITFAHVIKF